MEPAPCCCVRVNKEAGVAVCSRRPIGRAASADPQERSGNNSSALGALLTQPAMKALGCIRAFMFILHFACSHSSYLGPCITSVVTDCRGIVWRETCSALGIARWSALRRAVFAHWAVALREQELLNCGFRWRIMHLHWGLWLRGDDVGLIVTPARASPPRTQDSMRAWLHKWM